MDPESVRPVDPVDDVQEFSAAGTVYRSDGSSLPGERRYSIMLVPWYEKERPLAIGSFVELRNREPLELENEELSVELSDGRWFTFRVIDVSETPPHHHTLVAQQWPSHHHRLAAQAWRSHRAG
jgi:hypothetical protein